MNLGDVSLTFIGAANKQARLLRSPLMSFLSWGNYPNIKSTFFRFEKPSKLKAIISENLGLIAYGNGRSYGDSALSPNMIKTRQRNYFLDFDEEKGIIKVEAGVLLSEILDLVVPKGWFLKVTPGTKLVTVGGCIAADVHGKNHHIGGCFSECVESFSLMMADGEIKKCSKKKNVEIFRATCGGMGLTGVILDATLSLKKINSKNINQTTIKTRNLRETFDAFEEYNETPYSVAWIDCLAKGDDLGRCLLMVGDFADDGDLDYSNKWRVNVPFSFPSFTLNHATVKLLNFGYFRKTLGRITKQKVNIDTFFYPLDFVANWNRVYGKNGFTQYQCILPKDVSYEGYEEILGRIADAGKGSFLAILKLYGPANENYLSFPLDGYSLALDFKIESGLFELLDDLDAIVGEYGGRVYLAKDVRISKELFEKGYPMVEKFRALRKKYNLEDRFSSLQSKRVGI